MYQCFRVLLLAFVISVPGCKSTSNNSDLAAIDQSTSESGGDLTITSGKSGDIKLVSVGNRFHAGSIGYEKPSPPRADIAHFDNVTVDGKWYDGRELFTTLIPASRRNRTTLLDIKKHRWEISQIVIDRTRPALPIYENMCSSKSIATAHFLKSISYVHKNQLTTYTMEEVTDANLDDTRFRSLAGGTTRIVNNDDLAKRCWPDFQKRYPSINQQ